MTPFNEYLSLPTRKKSLLFTILVFGVATYLLFNPEYIQQKTFVDDSNLHVGQISNQPGNESELGIKDYAQFLSVPIREKENAIKNIMGNLGFEVHDYHDKYNVSGIIAVLKPRRTDDRNCFLLMGRYSRQNSSHLNSLEKNSLNTIGLLFSLAEKLSLQEWIGRNVIFVFLDDSTNVGINDFFNTYQENPLCGRILSGFEFDIQPSSKGPTNIGLLVGTYPYMSNQDIYNGYVHLIKKKYSYFKNISILSKYVNSYLQQFLLHSSLLRYSDSAEGPSHNIDTVLIQTKFNETQSSNALDNKQFVNSFCNLLKYFNNLYQQLQYSTYFYVPLNKNNYLNFPVTVALSVSMLWPLFMNLIVSAMPHATHYLFKGNENTANELIIVSDVHLSDKTEISTISGIKIVSLFYVMSTLFYILYLYLFGWNIISVEDSITFFKLTPAQKLYIICIATIPAVFSLVLSRICPPKSLAQTRLINGISGIPSIVVVACMVYVNQQLSLLYSFIVGITSLIMFTILFYKYSLSKVGKLISLLTSFGILFVLSFEYYKDPTILIFVPTISFILIMAYIPLSMSHIYVTFSFEKLQQEPTNESQQTKNE